MEGSLEVGGGPSGAWRDGASYGSAHAGRSCGIGVGGPISKPGGTHYLDNRHTATQVALPHRHPLIYNEHLQGGCKLFGCTQL